MTQWSTSKMRALVHLAICHSAQYLLFTSYFQFYEHLTRSRTSWFFVMTFLARLTNNKFLDGGFDTSGRTYNYRKLFLLTATLSYRLLVKFKSIVKC